MDEEQNIYAPPKTTPEKPAPEPQGSDRFVFKKKVERENKILISFLVILYIGGIFINQQFFTTLAFTLSTFLSGQFWQPFTYMFLHGSIGHLISNGLWIYFLGSDIEKDLNKPYLYFIFLFLSGMLGVAGIALNELLFSEINRPHIGILPFVYGLIIYYILRWPNRYIFLKQIRIKYAGSLLIIFGLLSEYRLQGIGGFLSGVLIYLYVRKVMKPGQGRPTEAPSNPY